MSDESSHSDKGSTSHVESPPATLQIPDPIALLSQELKAVATVSRATVPHTETDIYSWGYGVEGSLGHNNTANCDFPTPITAFRRMSIQHCSAGRHLSLFLDEHGHVFQCGQFSNRTTAAQWTPRRIEGLPCIQSTATGAKACYAISAPSKVVPHHVGQKSQPSQRPDKSDTERTAGGALYAWGSGEFGQLGLGTNTNTHIPRPVTALDHVRVTIVRAGFHFAAAITCQGHLYTWGYGRHGQLGHNSTTNELSPRRVAGLDCVVDVALGATHSLAISGSCVFGWGQNTSGCLGIGGAVDRDVLVPTEVLFFRHMQTSRVSAGSDHSLFLCLVGVKTYVYACGSNRFGQLGINSTVSHSDSPQCVEEFEYSSLSRRVAQVFAGDRYSVALLVTGQMFAWGDGSYSKSGHGASRTLTCVPWLVEAVSHRFALQIVVGYAHAIVLFRRDDKKTMNRFRQFPIQRIAPFLHLSEAYASESQATASDIVMAAVGGRCACDHTGRTDFAPFGLQYRCVTCNVEPICRWCSRHCHRATGQSQHRLEWVVLSGSVHRCACAVCPLGLLALTVEGEGEGDEVTCPSESAIDPSLTSSRDEPNIER